MAKFWVLGLRDGRRAWPHAPLPTLKSCRRCGGTWLDKRFMKEGQRCACWRRGVYSPSWVFFCNFGRRRPRGQPRIDLSTSRQAC